MKKLLLIGILSMMLPVSLAFADEAVTPHTFDDLNGDGVSDAQASALNGSPSSDQVEDITGEPTPDDEPAPE